MVGSQGSVAYATCVEGFRATCKPLILLDGTFLKDHYKGTLLVATTYDWGNGLFLLAFCVCDIENENNWDQFIRVLRQMLYEVPNSYAPPYQLLFKSDADKGLTNTREQNFSDALHSYCMPHLWEITRINVKRIGLNLKTSKELTKMLEWAAYKYNIHD